MHCLSTCLHPNLAPVSAHDQTTARPGQVFSPRHAKLNRPSSLLVTRQAPPLAGPTAPSTNTTGYRAQTPRGRAIHPAHLMPHLPAHNPSCLAQLTYLPAPVHLDTEPSSRSHGRNAQTAYGQAVWARMAKLFGHHSTKASIASSTTTSSKFLGTRCLNRQLIGNPQLPKLVHPTNC